MMQQADDHVSAHAKLKELFTAGVTQLSRTRAAQSKWWQECYRSRASKRDIFVADFIDSEDKSICRLTGQLGSGKTSFILDKIQNPSRRICSGIYIDIGVHSSKLGYGEPTQAIDHNNNAAGTIAKERDDGALDVDGGHEVRVTVATKAAVSGALYEIIATTIKKLFDDHFWHLEMGLGDEWFGIDITHRLDVVVSEPTDYQHIVKAESVQRKSRSAFILVNPEPELVKIRAMATRELLERKDSSAGNISRKILVETISDYLEKHPQVDQHVIQLIRAIPARSTMGVWIRAYARFFRSKDLILIIDNLDKVSSPRLFKVLVSTIRGLAYELRNQRLSGAQQSEVRTDHVTELKVAFAIRDANMPHLPLHAHDGAAGEVAICLGDEGSGFEDRNAIPGYLPLEREFLGSAVRSRLIYTSAMLSSMIREGKVQLARCDADIKAYQALGKPQPSGNLELLKDAYEKKDREVNCLEAASTCFEDFQTTIKSIWGAVFKLEKSEMPFEDLNNGSVRSFLASLADIALQLLVDMDHDVASIKECLDKQSSLILGPRVINRLFRPNDARQGLADFIRENKRLVHDENETKYLCCPYRLILTYLWNREQAPGKATGRVVIGAMAEHLEKWTGMPYEQVQTAVYYLFQSEDRQADYISLYQDEFPENEDGISRTGIVHINPRGRALLVDVMKRVEYWARIAGVQRSSVCLFELPPRDALRLLREVKETVVAMASAHNRNWLRLVDTCPSVGRADESVPFNNFAMAMLTFGRSLYMGRVAKSHKDAVLQYLLAIIDRDVHKLFLSSAERRKFEKLWPKHAVSLETLTPSKTSSYKNVVAEYKEVLKPEQQAEWESLYAIAVAFERAADSIIRLELLPYAKLRNEPEWPVRQC